MFTGIIEEMGIITAITRGIHSACITVMAKKVLENIHLGDSIAVNGVCLTASGLSPHHFTADVMAETMRCSSLDSLKIDSTVNLERAMVANGRFGGHIVSGHIDGTGTIIEQKREENAVWLTITAPAQILRYILEKGSVAIDGVSLTVATVGNQHFQVSIIPHTGQQTILLQKKQGDIVNLECDIIGKYVERFLTAKPTAKNNQSNINSNFLIENGFL